MNSALKPAVLPTSGSSQTPQQHKPMHPQGAPPFGQPSGHANQNPFPNMNVAHNHPNAQQNHFGLGGTTHYSMGAIPASNHPVASMNQTLASQQIFGPASKNLGYPGSFQGNMGHQQVQSTIPPVSQTLPATNQSPHVQQSLVNAANSTSNTPQVPEVHADQPQSNGTSDTKPEVEENHVAPQLPPQQSQESQVASITSEKPKSAPIVQEQKTPPEPEVIKPPEEPNVPQPPLPAPVPDTAEVPAVTDNKTSNTETDSLPIPTKPTDKPVPLKETEKESENVPPPKDSSSEEKVATSEGPNEISKSDAPLPAAPLSEPSEEEKSISESKMDTSSSASEEVVETTKSKVKEQSPPKKEVPQTKPTPQKTPARKPRIPKAEETKTPKLEVKTPAAVQKSPSTGKVKRQRIRTQHYQSPLPEIEIITKISSSTPRNKSNDEKLIYFYKNEFMAVRNAEGGFYLCQAVQNIYKSSSKIKIRWLSQDKNDKSGEIYTPDFYDLTDFDCILTSLDLTRVDKGKYRLSPAEKERTDSILKRCLAVEKGEISTPSLSEEHPDGLDLSLYKDEEQLKKNKKGTKRKSRSPAKQPQKATPVKKSPEAPKARRVEEVKTPAKKATPKKPVVTSAKKAPATPTSEPKKTQSSTSTSRLSRGKRKSDTKTSPVVDQKKAKVLAKIGRKTAVSASPSRSQPSKTKSASMTKTPTAKPTKTAVATNPVRETSPRKRSGRK